MSSHTEAVLFPVLLVLVGLGVLMWRMLRERGRGQLATAGGQPGMLVGLLILAAFAIGAFLTYALLGVR